MRIVDVGQSSIMSTRESARSDETLITTGNLILTVVNVVEPTTLLSHNTGDITHNYVQSFSPFSILVNIDSPNSPYTPLWIGTLQNPV